jgi:hypothetical protein
MATREEIDIAFSSLSTHRDNVRTGDEKGKSRTQRLTAAPCAETDFLGVVAVNFRAPSIAPMVPKSCLFMNTFRA